MKAFVTPCTYRPKTGPTYVGNGKLRVFAGMIEIARHIAYLGGDDADKVAAKLNLASGFRTQQGIWILSKKQQKKCVKMGVELLPTPDGDNREER